MDTFFNSTKPIKIRLTRDITKHIKRGNPWVFADVLEKKINSTPGSYAILLSQKAEVLAHGFYCSKTNLAFRVVSLGDQKIHHQMISERIKRAIDNKKHLYTSRNNSLRLINGEGDELPGVVCDIYARLAVLKLDGEAASNFWNPQAFAQFLTTQKDIPIDMVYLKRKNSEEEKGEVLIGEAKGLEDHLFLENGIKFKTNIIDAAKTGFFIDQRDNREFIRQVSKEKTLLNLFAYTGGFSVYAAMGGAKQVTSVDIAKAAIEASTVNWKLNELPENTHEAITEDAFKYVKSVINQKKTWDMVITDPPSFAPNQKSVDNAKKAYVDIYSDSIKLVKDGGFFVASSCSGHISSELFLELVQEALSKARRRGKVLVIKGQPEDHPYPMALSEMRYLKFIYLQVFKD